ncbi:MAG: ribosomal RNA small subunit methyltransferase A, partial [Candidatus Hodarchaeales archaeon]
MDFKLKDKSKEPYASSSSDLKMKLVRTLKKYVLTPASEKSQNFCVDSSLLSYLVSFSNLKREKDIVLEIGGGLGFLTRLLAEHCLKVISIELDPNLALLLERNMKNRSNVEIINADILKVDLSRLDFNCIVSNPPYKISSPLIFKILSEKPVNTIMTFQK